jgi:Cyclic nucleotide-binding domain
VRISSSVTALSWIPSEAVQGLPKLPFSFGIAHYDDPPPDRIVDLDVMHRSDLFREANELRAWIEVDDDGTIVGHGHAGRGRIGSTRLKIGPTAISVRAVALPTLQQTEVGDGWVRFTQTAGGRTGAPAPRSVRGKPYFQWHSAIAWTTLSLIIYATGTSKHSLVGASPFPRHWIYDKDGNLVEKSATIDFDAWYREAHEQNTPWGAVDSPAFVTAAESAFERELSRDLMRDGSTPRPEELPEGEILVKQGDRGGELFLLLDGVLEVDVDGKPVAEIGPGAIVGERALLEAGARTATLRATTRCSVVRIAGDRVDPGQLVELAAGRRREEPEA